MVQAGKHTFLLCLALEIVTMFYNLLLIKKEVHRSSSCLMLFI